MVERETRRPKVDKNKRLIWLVSVLAVILAAALIATVLLDPKAPEPTQSTQQQTESVKQTEATTVPTAAQKELVMMNPAETEFQWMERTLVFCGDSDPGESLTINGKEIPRSADGSFSYEFQLQFGMNEITVSHKGVQKNYKIEHQYTAKSFSPAEKESYKSGETVELEITAREGSEVKAQLKNTSVTMQKKQPQPEDIAEGFALYTGTYKLPTDNAKDINLGAATFTVICDGVEETYTSGEIVCKKNEQLQSTDPAVTPAYGNYIDVGSGYVVEIIESSAETFTGKTRDDYSDPRNNYLPKGTVDYGLSNKVYDKTGNLSYRVLRCGYRVYTKRKNYPGADNVEVVKCYKGNLPDHNEVGFASLAVQGSHTVLTLDTMWKAPFYFDLKPVTYNDPGARDFRVTKVTAKYVEITLCYATKFEGTVQIPADNPLFKSAELKKNEKDYTLRLNLKETGGFYGWDSYYNENDQLCFLFLNPTSAVKAENAYGADLTGLRIMIDVGHGGEDGGTYAKDAKGKKVDEADLNLELALLLQKELESMGATVIMNRTDDASLTVVQRIQALKDAKPDYCIAIHHNSYSPLSSVHGCGVMYFTPQSKVAAEAVYNQIKSSNVYRKTYLHWNPYYVARESVCPVVLVECGYMTNPEDLAGALDPATVQQKAKDMAQGVAKYFLNQ